MKSSIVLKFLKMNNSTKVKDILNGNIPEMLNFKEHAA